MTKRKSSYTKVSLKCYIIKFNVINRTFVYDPVLLNKGRKLYEIGSTTPLTIPKAKELFNEFQSITLQNSSCLFDDSDLCIDFAKSLIKKGYKYCR